MTYVESTNDVVHLHNIERWKAPPPLYNTISAKKQSLILEPRLTPPRSNFNDLEFFGPNS